MGPVQNLFYALGEMAYAIASADGKIQEAEKKALHNILQDEFKNHHPDFDYAEIIFKILEKDKTDLKMVYGWAMDEIRMHKDELTPVLKKKFIKVLQEVAWAFPPVSRKEQEIVYKFISELNSIELEKLTVLK